MDAPGPDDRPTQREALLTTAAERLRDAVGYWEARRIAYNGVLAAIVFAWVAATWPYFRPALTVQSFLLVLALAALANAGYCLAYPVDLAMQLSRRRESWLHRRWLLWLAGTLLAAALTCYWIADEIYPYIRQP